MGASLDVHGLPPATHNTAIFDGLSERACFDPFTG